MSLCQLIFHIGRSLKLRVLFRAGGYTGVQFFEILGSLFSFVVFGYLLSRLTFFVLGIFFGWDFLCNTCFSGIVQWIRSLGLSCFGGILLLCCLIFEALL